MSQSLQSILFIALFGLTFVLTGCSRISLAYRFADTSVYWYLDDQFDFKGDQPAKVKAELAKAKEKLRKEWLPLVTEELKQTAEFLEKTPPQDEAAAIKFFDEKELFWQKLLLHAWTLVTPELQIASEPLAWQNWESFRQAYAKQSDKIKRESQGKCASRLENQINGWTGDTTREQEKRIEIYCQDKAGLPEERAANRDFLLTKFEEFAGLTEKTFSGPKLVASLEGWTIKQRELSLPAYKDKKEVARTELKKTLSWILINLTKKQSQHLIETLRSRAEQVHLVTIRE
ncbi:MAG: hypothetical protein ACK5P7_11230 [Bdellovibrio sp.]|jgi:hypothetical protein